MGGVPYVSQIRDAASLNAKDNLTCEERHKQCQDISLKESYNKSVHRVNKVKEQINRPASNHQQQQNTEHDKDDRPEQEDNDDETSVSDDDEEDAEEEYEYEYYD